MKFCCVFEVGNGDGIGDLYVKDVDVDAEREGIIIGYLFATVITDLVFCGRYVEAGEVEAGDADLGMGMVKPFCIDGIWFDGIGLDEAVGVTLVALTLFIFSNGEAPLFNVTSPSIEVWDNSLSALNT
eukprot:Pompholyxophrys_sp_v1_NODE_9_length_5690_cov_16.428039.p5 type:complete len:128 gc:universal NODE_9_length_5690_cov_16.428039:3683-3300(-)